MESPMQVVSNLATTKTEKPEDNVGVPDKSTLLAVLQVLKKYKFKVLQNLSSHNHNKFLWWEY
jgi:hypothetical protein